VQEVRANPGQRTERAMPWAISALPSDRPGNPVKQLSGGLDTAVQIIDIDVDSGFFLEGHYEFGSVAQIG
jgi:hypothetical protein